MVIKNLRRKFPFGQKYNAFRFVVQFLVAEKAMSYDTIEVPLKMGIVHAQGPIARNVLKLITGQPGPDVTLRSLGLHLTSSDVMWRNTRLSNLS